MTHKTKQNTTLLHKIFEQYYKSSNVHNIGMKILISKIEYTYHDLLFSIVKNIKTQRNS